MGGYQEKHSEQGKIITQIKPVPSPLMGISRDLEPSPSSPEGHTLTNGNFPYNVFYKRVTPIEFLDLLSSL